MPAFDVVPSLIQAVVRDTSRPNLAVGNQSMGLSNGLEQYIVHGLPPKTELARIGAMNCVRIATASKFTTVAAYPSTRAELVLYNGEASTGKSYIIDSVAVIGVVTMAAAGSVALLAQIVPGIAAPTDDTAQLITNYNGSNYGGNAKRAVATTTAVAEKWEILNSSQSGGSATAQVGLASYADCWGKYIVKPGNTFAVNCIVGTAAAASAIMQVTWAEITINI